MFCKDFSKMIYNVYFKAYNVWFKIFWKDFNCIAYNDFDNNFAYNNLIINFNLSILLFCLPCYVFHVKWAI